MLPTVAVAMLMIDWIAWVLAFVRAGQLAKGQKKVARDPASLWGIVLVAIGFFFIWIHVWPAGFHKSPASLIVSICLGPPSVLLAWLATAHLGKQWRYEAAITEGHELIQTGPYRYLRHPIYASMFGMLLTAGFCLAWWPMFLAGVVFFIAGTEVRVRAEERLLTASFGSAYTTYRAHTSAYIPFLR